MPLENLLTLVETLRDRVDDHGDALRQNEMLTRYALIDPLLRELGWDTEDPDVVVPEYRVPNNKISDYVLLHDGRPEIVVEAKKLDESLQSGKALDQGILYCAHTGANYFLLTDGNRWELYKSGNTSPTTSFNLTDRSATEACLKALALWRSSVISGRIQVGQTPVINPNFDPTNTPTEEPSVQSPPPTENQPSPLDEQGWQPLSALKPQTGDSPPTEILFPDKSTVSIKWWKDIMVEVVRWLINKNILNKSHCPIRRGRAKRYLVSTEPIHSDNDNKRFTRPRTIGSFHIETYWVRSSNLILNTKYIIDHFDCDPTQFKVRFPDR